MKHLVLQSLGFKQVHRAGVNKVVKPTQPDTALVSKEGTQLRIRIPRSVMNKMHWEISQRIKVMINEADGTVALIRARNEDKDSHVIGFQSSTKEDAINRGYPGVIRISTDAFGEVGQDISAQEVPLIHDRSTIIINVLTGKVVEE